MVEFRRNKNTGKIEAYKNGVKIGSVITMGDKEFKNNSKKSTKSLYIFNKVLYNIINK